MNNEDKLSIHYGDSRMADETVNGKKFIVAYLYEGNDVAFRTNAETVGEGAVLTASILGSIIAAACDANDDRIKKLINDIVSDSLKVAGELRAGDKNKQEEAVHGDDVVH